MTEHEAKKRITVLVDTIRHHADLYYRKDTPEITDEVYDSLYAELVSLEQAFPQYKDPLSPTVRVGGMILEGFEKATHIFPQWSFDNVFDWEDLQKWETKIKRFVEKKSDFNTDHLEYIAELKIDGLKVILDYEQGRLVRAATRGDGKIGENITENTKTIAQVPLVVSEQKSFSVVGEVWIKKDDLDAINIGRMEQGLDPYANPRNLAAGTLRQLDTSVVAERNLQIFVYDVDSTDLSWETHQEELSWLADMGFNVNTESTLCTSITDVQSYYDVWVSKRHGEQYGIDGMVIKMNNMDLCQLLGYTAKAPRFAVAYKFPAEQKTTIVLDIVAQIGRTGVLTPVAELEPVLIDGSMVKRATLHNADEIARLDIRLGDTVVVEKAGDIIPKIKSVITDLRSAKAKRFSLEAYFKDHNMRVRKEESSAGVVSWYLDDDNNDEQSIMRLAYFASKKAMNIDGLGEKNVRALYSAGFVKTFSDFYTLTFDQVVSLPLFKEKATQNLLDAIEQSKQTTPQGFLTGLGIKHVGEEVAELYAAYVEDLHGLISIDMETLLSIHGVGEKIAESTITWFQDPLNQTEYKTLLGILTFEQTLKATDQALDGLTFVITGSFDEYSRDDVKALIKHHGGKTSSSLSGNTDYVIAGEKAGSKLEKAKNLKVPILNIDSFLKKIKK